MLEYIDEGHLYLYDGVIIPSVSQLIEKIFPNKYKGVPENILNAKAKYGTEVHKLIEDLENGKEIETNNYLIETSINQYIRLKYKNNIKVLEQEKIVCYKGLYAGRYDMVASIDGKKCLCDIKTTAQLDKEYLSWQLSLYELASGEKFDDLYAIWLPKKELAQLVKIKRKSKKELLELIGGK